MADKDFIDSVENAIEGLVGFARRYARTFGTIARHPLRAPALFEADAAGEARRYVPPLTFAIVAFVVFNTTAAIWGEVFEHVMEPDGWGRTVDAISSTIGGLQAAPGRMIALALPIVVILLGSAYLGRLISGAASRRVIAVVAYSTAFVWVGTAIAGSLAVFLAAVFQTFAANATLAMLAFFVTPAILAVATLVVVLLFIFGNLKARAAESGARRVPRVALGYALCLVFAHVATGWLLFRGLGQAVGLNDLTKVDVELRAASLPDRPGEQVTLARLPRQAEDWTYGRRPPRPCTRVALVASVRNRRADAVFIPRDLGMGGLSRWQITAAPASPDAPRALTDVLAAPGALRSWSDGGAPVMMIKPGEIKWVEVEGCIPGSDVMASGKMYVRLSGGFGDGQYAYSGWAELQVLLLPPRPAQIENDTAAAVAVNP